jgi:ANCHR-like B-box zinc-binding domain
LSTTSPNPPTPESDLSARLRSLRNGSSSPSPIPKPILAESSAFPTAPAEDPDPLHHPIDPDDKTLDELLADLGSDDQWTLNPDDPNDIKKLLDEARSALPPDQPRPTSPAKETHDDPNVDGKRPNKTFLTRDLDMSVFALDDEDGKEEGRESRLEDESREAQDIVARLLDEVNFERANEPQDQKKSQDELRDGDEEEPAFVLPSAPSKLPDLPAGAESSKKSLDFESDIAARMAALKGLGSTNELGLPSAPTFKPLDKPVQGLMKKYTDEEIESWCIICQDDATVKCLGCDGDLYCAKCWKEGHMGPDVGWEERRHKWTKFRKPN